MSIIELDEHQQRARLLIVDDQAANVKLLERHLAAAGFRNVMSTTDPRQVESIYQQEPVDLVLLDIRMPHMDGYQVMELLRRLAGNEYLPILILTAQTDPDTKLKALQMGANDFLTKPFDNVEVLLRVKNMLDARRLHIELSDFNDTLAVRIKQKTAELQDTILEVVRRLGKAAEYRDNETGFHVIRMSKYSYLIARQMGISEEEASVLEYAAAMHDIGKIGTPDNILLKPGALDDEEWRIMKEHTSIGGDILSNSRYRVIQLAEEIARTHHEKWDGSGYPAGLKGEEIPRLARIIPVSDVFDALTSVRPYKKAWPVDDAVDEIKKSSGAHFDPAVVSAFEQCLPQILEVKTQYAEPHAD